MSAQNVQGRTPARLVRPIVRRLHGYVPGEQPKIRGLIKLNTNENPYPPAPPVLDAIQAAVDGRLRLYPNPAAQPLREKLARLHHCEPENILVGNGSDELLALATRAFVEPMAAAAQAIPSGAKSVKPNRLPACAARDSSRGERGESSAMISRETVQFFTPSYSLYPVLAAIHGARARAVPLADDFTIPAPAELRRTGLWDFRAALSFVTTPNAPSGRGYATRELETLCRGQRGLLVLDEAYVDFAEENALALALRHSHVLVARTFSKAYSLCFLRVGYFVGHPDLIAALDKIRDSYNVNGLGQVAALATLRHLPYYQSNFHRVVATRLRLSRELTGCGFAVLPSQANFILARPPVFPAVEWLEKLRSRKILVRWFGTPEISDYLRITVGSDEEASALLRAVQAILRS